MVIITLRAIEEPDFHEVSAKTFPEAAIELQHLMLGVYSVVPPEIYEGLGVLAKLLVIEAETSGTYEHRDFSCPEEQFDLSFEVFKE